MTSKKPLILALVLFNAALLGLLVVMHGQQAQAQVVPGAVGRFIGLTQRVDDDVSMIWVGDTVTRRLLVYRMERQSGRLRASKAYRLKDVFRFREPEKKGGRGTK